MKRSLILAITHGAMLALGFALGVYFLPILTAPPAPDAASLEQKAQGALFTAQFERDLKGSDFLHWGEGKISIKSNQIIHEGKLAPGPDYKVYLTNQFVEHEDEFLPIKEKAQYIGDVKTFDGFLLGIPKDVDVSQYTTIVIWCEAFSEFITAAQYR